MRKKGFTLIELLAVIVVLAIIALIATPIVMSTIESTQKESAKLSMGNIKKTAELYYVNRLLSTNASGTQFKCDNGVCSNGTDTLQIKGVNPISGTIFIDEKGNVTLDSIVINGYLCIENGDDFSCDKTNGKQIVSTNDAVLTINDAKESTLTNYKIYGNSIQQTYTGKNLCDSSNDNYVYLKDYNNFTINSGTVTVTDKAYFGFIIKVKPNTTYTVSYEQNADNFSGSLAQRVREYSAYPTSFKDNYISETVNNWAGSENGVIKSTFTTSSTTQYIVFGLYANAAGLVVKNFQVEEGSSATSYEPYVGGIAAPNPDYPQEISSVGDLVTDSSSANYGKYEISLKVTGESVSKSNMYNIYLDEPLRCVNGVCDYIDFKTGKLARNISTITYDGSADEGWARYGNANAYYGYIIVNNSAKNVVAKQTICNRLSAQSGYGFGWNGSKLGCFLGNTNASVPGFVITSLSTTVTDLRTELANKPLDTIFILATPIEKSIELPNVKLFEGTNHISVETNVKSSNIEIEYYD